MKNSKDKQKKHWQDEGKKPISRPSRRNTEDEDDWDGHRFCGVYTEEDIDKLEEED